MKYSFLKRNMKIYIIALVLLLVTGLIMFLRIRSGIKKIDPNSRKNLWHLQTAFTLNGKGESVRVRMTLPQNTSRQSIFNEMCDNEGFSFSVENKEDTGNRMGVWKADFLSKPMTIKYNCSILMQDSAVVHNKYDLNYRPPEPISASGDRNWLESSDHIQSQDSGIIEMAKSLVRGKKTQETKVRALFEFVSGSITYKSAPGSKDAKSVLNSLEADCGGQSRLLCALSRAVGIPSRVVGGIILKEEVKNTTHVWVEVYVNGSWYPLDVTNQHYGVLPATYLELYKADTALIRHKGLEKLAYVFVIKKETTPPFQGPFSLHSLPLPAQDIIQIFLLICVGSVCVVVFRVFIGLPTFGTFTPILIAVAFIKIPFLLGAISLAIALVIGWILRVGLDKLYILALPRLSIIFIAMVMCVVFMIMVGQMYGLKASYSLLMFPMVILTWSVERFSMLQMEDGMLSAVKTSMSTFLISLTTYFLLKLESLQGMLFSFPELLLVIIALHLLMGRYTGYRLMELLRFSGFKDASIGKPL